MQISVLLLLGCCCLPMHAESACFRSAKEAALQAGVRDGEGFRLEGIRMDRVGGGRWARVVSCLHPERPGVAVRLLTDGEEHGAEMTGGKSSFAGLPPSAGRVVVSTGSIVRVVKFEDNVRLEMAGVAQGSGAVGESIRVRVGAAGDERFLAGVVRGEGLVDLEAGR